MLLCRSSALFSEVCSCPLKNTRNGYSNKSRTPASRFPGEFVPDAGKPANTKTHSTTQNVTNASGNGKCESSVTLPLVGSLLGGSLMFSPRSAVFAAFSCGGLVSVLLRPSRRSLSGAVVVAGFASAAGAFRFARRAARRAGVSVAVRRGPGGAGGAWVVSCPVAVRSSRWPVGVGSLLPLAGLSVSGLSSALASAGLPRR